MILMVLNIVFDLIFSLFELFKGAFILTIPIFVLVFLALKIKTKLIEKYELSWFKSAFLSTSLINFILLILAFFLPILSSIPEESIGLRPDYFQVQPSEILLFVLLTIGRLLLTAVLFALIIMPFALFSSLINAYFKEKFNLNSLILLFASVFISVIIASAIILFLTPWLPLGLIYFVFYAF